VDKCPDCSANSLGLYDSGYKELLPSQGYWGPIDINWNIVSCRFSAPLAVQNKEGTSQYWFSMQVQNANFPIVTLQVSTDYGNTWQDTVSRDYNFFEKPNTGGGGFGTQKVDIKITCFNDNVVYLRDIDVNERSKTWADANC
jgi:expansin (peptidoglycan-binding protein)